MSKLAVIGDNKPPSPIEFAEGLIAGDLNRWMGDHPVIETDEDARDAKAFLDRSKLALEEIEAERVGKVKPLNDEVAAINLHYKMVHNTDKKNPGLFDKIVGELKSRLAAHLQREEDKRLAAAEAARRAQEEAERAAREAEAHEREALSNAASGELEVDVAALTQEADTAFKEFEKQSRFAARAERDTRARVGGGFGRAAGLRDVETLHLESYNRAIKAIGPNDKIKDAILSAARDFRKEHGNLPDGVTATYERKL